MGGVRTYNQCRHRWHNVIKHRGMNPEDMAARLAAGGDESFHYPSHDQTQDWSQLQHQHSAMSLQHPQLQPSDDASLTYLQKYDV